MKELAELFRRFQPEIGRGWPMLGTDQNSQSPVFES